MKLPELPELPVRSALDEIVETLTGRGVAVLVAPPGTGKTTLVPLALAAATEGKVVVAEPRRLAARAAAARMAALLGERVGETVGYAVRGDRKVGARTRIEVVTSGLLVRRLQQDPELPGVGTVVLDECHERHLDADLLLALLLDARSGLRPDLRVLATSATVAAGRLAALLGPGESAVSADDPDTASADSGSDARSASSASDASPSSSAADASLACSASDALSARSASDALLSGQASDTLSARSASDALSSGQVSDASSGRSNPDASSVRAASNPRSAYSAPVLEVRGRAYPVEVEYVPALARERVEAQVGRAVRAALEATEGDVLVFLPGVGEINRTAGLLRDLRGVDVVPLHGRLGSSVQDTVLRAGVRRRVVLSTAVAESSLTVPGVRAVVDSGLSRVPRIDHRRGLSGLATVRVSAAVAEQRAGRAGREAPGRAWRCWPEYEHQTLPAYPEPEIRTAELARLALELACWGTPDGSGLAWWDAPPEGGLAAGRSVLHALGALDESGRVTERGRAMSALGLHPRLARALLDGATHVGPRAAAEMVVLMDDDSLARTPDAAAALRALRTECPPRWVKEVQRLVRLLAAQGGAVDDPPHSPDEAGDATQVSGSAGAVNEVAAVMIALAQPERLARRRAGGASYLMAGGTAVTLSPGSGLADAEWLAVAVADRDPGRAEGRIRLAAIADEGLARAAAPGLVTEAEEVRWESGAVVARRVERLGAIVLSEKPLREPDPALLERAVREGLRTEGLALLRWDDDARGLRERLAFLHRTLGDPWPAVDDDTLLADLDHWLAPDLTTVRRRADLARVDAGTALRRLLPWPAAARLDELAPERLEVPSGSRIRLDYSADQPVLAVKVQEIFGWTASPTLADGRAGILLHLLSPAQRPVAVTADLPSFWRTGWPQVRADLRGRYPKHAWPEDPTTVIPHRGTARRTRET
ncbi:ATP-dependent helicase HrpB [Nocardia sp. SSK8]|uniref:ATP-dependent helicase HrpB n=1 Tax=Nocardia sp. SSK8 TaxID=3120154 RepID=UPI00300AEA0A